MAGGFAPIKDVPKTLVYELCRLAQRAARRGRPIPDAMHRRSRPRAELRPDQQDTDSLPPYEELDPIIEAYVEEDRASTRSSSAGMDARWSGASSRMVDRAEYKRRQAAPGVKITPKAFGRDRRMPDHEPLPELRNGLRRSSRRR